MLKAYGWIALFLGVAILIGGPIAAYVLIPCWGCLLTPDRFHRPPAGYYRGGYGNSIKTLTSAQADFRANDRDANGKHEFRRGDVAGLYALSGMDGQPIKLIELSVALADAAPLTPMSGFGTTRPTNDYWFRAIRHEDEDPLKLDPQRFAYAAIPVVFPRHQRFVFIVDENNTIFRSDQPYNLNVSVFPKDPAKAGWSKLD